MTTSMPAVRVGLVGLGKMGISHLSMVNAHPLADVVAVCDATGYLLDGLGKYTGLHTQTDFDKMIEQVPLDAVIISTPTTLHAPMVRRSLEAGIDVFCEKPFTLDADESAELAQIALERGLIGQVGYHCRFVGSFREVKRLLDLDAIGRVTHALAEAYGPVVLRPKGSTWRTQRNQGGGCLYDYAAHPLNLLNWYLGDPHAVRGSVLNPIFSKETEDEVYSTLFFDGGVSAQLSVNWSDESQRKMSTKVSLWGTNGTIVGDRQECRVFLREPVEALQGVYSPGWNVRYTTDLTEPVWFYVRGEEYSAQLDHFVHAVAERRTEAANSFGTAAQTDRVLAMIVADAAGGGRTSEALDRSGSTVSAQTGVRDWRGWVDVGKEWWREGVALAKKVVARVGKSA